MNAIRGTVAAAGALAFALTLGGCGHDDCTKNPTGPGCPVTTTTTTLPPAVRTLIQSSNVSLPSSTLWVNEFTTPKNGTLDITVDWTFASSRIGVYVVREACTLDQFNARTCKFVTTSETTQKPRTITLTGFTAGTYQLLIGNFANADESISYQIGLTTGGTASSASAGEAGSRDPRIGGPLSNVVSH
jgi:hypothetical protein